MMLDDELLEYEELFSMLDDMDQDRFGSLPEQEVEWTLTSMINHAAYHLIVGVQTIITGEIEIHTTGREEK